MKKKPKKRRREETGRLTQGEREGVGLTDAKVFKDVINQSHCANFIRLKFKKTIQKP